MGNILKYWKTEDVHCISFFANVFKVYLQGHQQGTINETLANIGINYWTWSFTGKARKKKDRGK